jgi:hypothetical protein
VTLPPKKSHHRPKTGQSRLIPEGADPKERGNQNAARAGEYKARELQQAVGLSQALLLREIGGWVLLTP